MTFFDIFSGKTQEKQQNLPKIIIDNREKNSLVPSELSKLNHPIDFQHLQVADYLVNDIALERKTISDLKSSIIDKRIFSQLLEIKQYPKNFLIIEGPQSDLYNNEVLHANALRGFILAVQSEYLVPIIFTENEKESALYLSILSKKKPSSFSLRPGKIAFTKEEQLQYILEGFPNIGPKTAKKLLDKFKSLKQIFTASEEELLPILGKKSDLFLFLLNHEASLTNPETEGGQADFRKS